MRHGFLALTLLSLTLMPGCGGGGDTAPTPVATPTPAPPQARIQANGNGSLVLHPSLGSTFAIAMETPIRIQETAGGTADWNFARFSLFLNGAEIERGEIGSNTIRDAGVSRIDPNSDETVNVLFRFNSSDFNSVAITLGFGDVNRGGTFEVQVPFSSFSGIRVSTVPLFAAKDQISAQ